MYKRILVPVDGSDTSKHGLAEALTLAKVFQAQVRLVHVVDEVVVMGAEQLSIDYERIIDALCTTGRRILSEARDAAAAAGVDAQVELIESLGTRAADLIVKDAQVWKADLIVMGTHGRRGIGRWALGSDAESVLRSATVPVLLVRKPVS